MAGICTNSIRKSHATDGHRVVTVNLDGETISSEFFDEDFDAIDWNGDLPAQWRQLTLKQLYVLLGIKKVRLGGVTIADLINRVTNGEEATNVKQYQFFGPGAAITKTNIGTAYVNICPGANGERIAADFTGCTEYRVVLHANLGGTGQWGARIVRDNDSEVLVEAPNLGAAGERELDPGWTPLPAAFLGQGLTYLRAQAKSQTTADDPVFRSLTLGLR